MPTPLLTISDYEERAKELLPRPQFDRMFGRYGAPDEISETNNIEAFAAIKLRPRVLVDVSRRDLSTQALGLEIRLPIMLAPAGWHQQAHPDGELATARAAGAAGTIMGLSTTTSYSYEEVARAATGPLLFQTFFFRDRKLTETLVRRVEEAGYAALMLTVDLGDTTGVRQRQARYSYTHEAQKINRNFSGIDLPGVPTWDNIFESYDPGLNWSHLEWLRSLTSMPLVIKGIQTAEDASLCVEHGVDAIVVSNHGGHAAEGTSGTIEMLPEVVDVVGDRLEIFMDGGIRRGTDVLKALALGARAVFIGRSMFWGLVVDGESGVRGVLDILRGELEAAMGLCGVTDVKHVDRSLVIQPGGSGRPDSVTSQLERLANLLEKGYLTRHEFETLKGRLLGT